MRTGRPPNLLPADRSAALTTEPSLSRRRGSTLLGTVILALPIFAAAVHASEARVALSIKNDDTQSLRCAIIFAHWVTSDIGPIASGETATVAMTRGPQPGALHIARFDGRPMMIENIVCGADKDWSNSLDQLPLTLVRDSPASSYQMACRVAPRVVCTPSPEFSSESHTNSSDAH
jgi:hypothetical protein